METTKSIQFYEVCMVGLRKTSCSKNIKKITGLTKLGSSLRCTRSIYATKIKTTRLRPHIFAHRKAMAACHYAVFGKFHN